MAIDPLSPTQWGLSDSSPSGALNGTGAPDVDGFLVNTGANSQPGQQDQPVVADSVGEFLGVLWRTDPASNGQTHIRGQFYDLLGNPDIFLPVALDISDGLGIEARPALVSGGANSGWGAAWEQRDSATDPTAELRARFVGPGFLAGDEFSVFTPGEGERGNTTQHDASLSGSFLDRTLVLTPTQTTPVDPKAVSDGFNVAWVSTALDSGGAPTDLAGDAHYGRIMLQRFEVPFDPTGNPLAPVAAGIDGLHNGGANSSAFGGVDAAVWVGAETTGTGGSIGRDPSTTALHGFETIVTWIEKTAAGAERVVGRAYDDLGHVINVPALADISGGFPVAAGTRAHVVSAGAVNFGVVWITGDAASGFRVMGTMFTPTTGNGVNGQDFGFDPAASGPFELQRFPAGTDPASIDLHSSGLSGEDSSDLVLTWQQGGNVLARHVAVSFDPVTGVVAAMTPVGDAVGTLVNASTPGADNQNSVAGLLSDRFISVYHDTSGATGDIVAQIMDTRPLTPDPNRPGHLIGADITGDLVQNGVAKARADVMAGTVGDDTMRGDISDADGRADQLYGARGDDIIQGGPGDDLIDGGEGSDIAVFGGRFQDYSITLNGDGSLGVIDLRPKQSATGGFLPNDDSDVLRGIEFLRFLGDGGLTVDPGFQPPPPVPQNPERTPKPWSIDDTSQFKEFLASTDPNAPAQPQPGTQDQVAVASLQTDAAVIWHSGGNHVFAVRYDIQGKIDTLFAPGPVELTDPAALTASTADPVVTMAGGVGFLGVWESTSAAGQTSIHLRFASMATNTVFDAAAGLPGSGLAGGEVTVVGSGTGVSADAAARGYEIVDDANDTLEFGFHVAFVSKALADDTYGKIELARYEIPVFDVDLVTGAVLGDSADLNRGAETQPVSIGADGIRGTADDASPATLQRAGIDIAGRDPSTASLHDGQLVLTWIEKIGDLEHVRIKVFSPNIDQDADRDTVAGADHIARGRTVFEERALPFPDDLGAIATGTRQEVVAQQNGSFAVLWATPDGSGGISVKAQVFLAAGLDNWTPGPVTLLKSGLALGTDFHLASTGVTQDAGALEDGFLLTWNTGDGHVKEQRFDMLLAPVGIEDTIDSGSHSGHTVAGIDDGRILVGHDDQSGDVSAQFLDTRAPGIPIIGPRDGANRDVAVGTVGDDAMDGRDREDELHGGLGNDLVTGGIGADLLDGGAGNDTLIGGTDQDQLLGGDGDDLLSGGPGGETDRVTDRALPANLQGRGVDVLSGGAGNDTVTYRGEPGRFDINLATGIIQSDRTGSGFVAEDVIGELVDDGTGHFVFASRTDVENAEGSGGNDILRGNTGANSLNGDAGNDTITGGGGNDTVIGGAGADTAVFSGAFSAYAVTFNATTHVYSVAHTGADGTDAVRDDVEFFQFADRTLAAADALPAAPPAGATGGPDNLVGTAGPDTIDGLGGNDTISGLGGNDRLLGNTENDSLAGGGGNDTLEGGAGDDTLVGGAGSDSMLGGAGNDLYVVADAGDTLVEDAGAGTDTVQASLDFSLAGLANIENLRLTGTAQNGTGNALANTLTGNAAANTLDGAAGADTMAGGAGNDTYVVDNAGDVVTEALGAGTDLVLSSVTRVLGGNQENLTLTGAGAINGNGNALDNVITGNAAANRLVGGAGADVLIGGAGLDTLTGGAGADLFQFNSATEGGVAGGVRERIADFTPGTDGIDISATGFVGSLAPNMVLDASYLSFIANPLPADRVNHSQFQYNTTTGALSWDVDGLGHGAAPVLLTTLTGAPAGLAIGDFHIIA